MFSYHAIRSWLFALEPEVAHKIFENLAWLSSKSPLLLPLIAQAPYDERLSQCIDGLEFYHPVGLAAGFDKNACMLDMLNALGFSFLEIGAITPKPQAGNPKPRIWRHVQEESLQNAMGFNNHGVSKIAQRLGQKYPYCLPIGINIGKNKDTPAKKAMEDYILLIRHLKDCSDYVSVNISSPNTQGLRDLQNEDFIKGLIYEARQITHKPIYLKFSPDLSCDEIARLTQAALESGYNGIIATNTTLDYSLLKAPKEQGGISGKALKEKSLQALKEISRIAHQKMTIISVGGIGCAADVLERIKFGANLVQIYSALIFEGPLLVKQINKELLNMLNQDGFHHISEAVGVNL